MEPTGTAALQGAWICGSMHKRGCAARGARLTRLLEYQTAERCSADNVDRRGKVAEVKFSGRALRRNTMG